MLTSKWNYNCFYYVVIKDQKSNLKSPLTTKKKKWKRRYKYINLCGRTLWYMNIFLTRACKFSLILRQLFTKTLPIQLWIHICYFSTTATKYFYKFSRSFEYMKTPNKIIIQFQYVISGMVLSTWNAFFWSWKIFSI